VFCSVFCKINRAGFFPLCMRVLKERRKNHGNIKLMINTEKKWEGIPPVQIIVWCEGSEGGFSLTFGRTRTWPFFAGNCSRNKKPPLRAKHTFQEVVKGLRGGRPQGPNPSLRRFAPHVLSSFPGLISQSATVGWKIGLVPKLRKKLLLFVGPKKKIGDASRTGVPIPPGNRGARQGGPVGGDGRREDFPGDEALVKVGSRLGNS